ncbi:MULTISPECIES: tripartite tricarboxylate transporter substrate binding protein [unclassified Variovorax]|uniref:Bug family tripartite tricarboxylate transporter substrate binding protein n=1 Tax=unclassified Variovorax TaxID=663243 RepID=UPI0025783CDB|nr:MULTISPECIES: tripartite tricarboxylate transporter substrate binding protein [unclassified Variovorax]MDM0070289.1 tripartite tricarboxylate transporter substrate binding protein [Variovorax sp. J31P207]MDM0083321.1 tripartite tricarboxylate transporter substrate binding protein [Variovorax sp. J31P179]
MKKPIAKPLLLAAALLGTLAGVASAQPSWPGAKPITLIVPYSAGGSVDFTARLVATKLGERLKQSVVIENVTGAGGAIGVAKAVNAAPDGYTLVAGPDSAIAIGRLINPAAFKFDPLKDLAPVGMLNTAPMVLVARPGLPVKDFADFVKLAKASPGKFNYATSGVGTVLQLAMELLKERTGIFVTHVPYRGGAQIATDVIGNQVDLAMLVSTSAIPHVTGNRLKALGVTGSQRLEALPQVPAFGEMPGLKGFDMVSWTGIFAPANTPAPIVSRLNQELNAVLKDPEVRAKLQEQGALPGTGSPEDLGRFVKSEYARNQKIVQAANIKE